MNAEYEQFLKSWRDDFYKEICRLFEDRLPEFFSMDNIEIDLSLTGKDAAIHYYSAYKGF